MVYAINTYVCLFLCFQCLVQLCIRWYPKVLGHNIRVVKFDPDHELPEYELHTTDLWVESQGTIELAYFTVAKTYMPIHHNYKEEFYP